MLVDTREMLTGFLVFYISLLYNEFLVTGATDTFPAFYLLLFCVPVYVYGT